MVKRLNLTTHPRFEPNKKNKNTGFISIKPGPIRIEDQQPTSARFEGPGCVNYIRIMKKYIVFDFDGTIADTYQDILTIVNDLKKDKYKEIDFEDIRDHGARYLIKKAGIPFWKIPKFVYQAASKLKRKNNIRLFPEILDVFKELSKKYKLGILSSNSEENIRIVLKKYKVEDLFEFIYSNSSIFGKHLVLKRMCRKYKINPEDIIYIGDEDRDIIAAKKAKIKIIAVTWGFNSEKLLKEKKPDYLVNNPKEILKKCCR